ncbi:predicted membrane protein [Sanguibacter keddieii DSM 10542]|uniref:Predicted membrane protein n=1 Tax=Sanguibacter keddieii (strain ATCC 51767 / DSM 10542 / NCFB 3025 / ST-74) TaxID=446469 RepID=D1BDI8_SANKS|nr:putative sulfate exporter family transporter [Sanguibacter keddieii]ACZ21050.1 predicted membrane protein [Sanguibacter keddieii DSM 10542]
MNLPPGLSRALPGLLLVAVAAAASLVLAPAITSLTGVVASPLVVALVAGALLGSLRAVPGVAWAGVGWARTHVLRAGVVLLGLQLSLGQLVGLGWRGLLVVLATVVCTFAVTLRVGQALRVDALTRLYVATGFSICGAAAIAAMSGTVGARTTTGPSAARADSDAVGTALALVTLYGTLAVLVLPWFVRTLGLTDAQAGLLVGASVQEVGQVVAAAGGVSAAALAAATVAKLARVVLLAPLTAAVAARDRSRVRAGSAAAPGAPAGDPVGPEGARRSVAPLVPGFVLAFLVAVLVRSSGLVPDGLLSAAQALQQVLLTAAMVALGAGVDLPRLVRSGGRPLVLGAVSTLVAVGTATAGTMLLT